MSCGGFIIDEQVQPAFGQDLRINGTEGMKFEDAMRRILGATPIPKKSKRKKPVKNLHLN
jgi:hypothetical protein